MQWFPCQWNKHFASHWKRLLTKNLRGKTQTNIQCIELYNKINFSFVQKGFTVMKLPPNNILMTLMITFCGVYLSLLLQVGY